MKQPVFNKVTDSVLKKLRKRLRVSNKQEEIIIFEQ